MSFTRLLGREYIQLSTIHVFFDSLSNKILYNVPVGEANTISEPFI